MRVFNSQSSAHLTVTIAVYTEGIQFVDHRMHLPDTLMINHPMKRRIRGRAGVAMHGFG